MTFPRAKRLAYLDRTGEELPLKTQAALLGLNRTSLYYVPQPPTAEEVYIKRRIDEMYTASPFYGYRKITVLLQAEMVINHKAVQRHMREMGLVALCPGPHLSQPAPEHPVFPYLLRGLRVIRPNQVWGIDITYIRLAHGWLYLVAVLDWFSRYVLSWELDQTLELPFVLAAVERALAQATPPISSAGMRSPINCWPASEKAATWPASWRWWGPAAAANRQW